MPKFGLGWVRQPHDPRDRYYLTPNRVTAALPASYDVDLSAVPLLDQGQLGSCGPNTAEELLYKDESVQNLPMVGASRLFIYYWTRYLMGTVSQDSGVDNRSMCKALANYGFPAEALWPYDDTQSAMVRKPPQTIMDAAAPNKLTDYAAVVQSLSQMKGCLAGDRPRPFMFGFDVFSQMESDAAAATGILTKPPSGASPIGGHDVSICGYSDVDLPGVQPGKHWPAGTFKFRNHWTNSDGSPWGDGGYGYIPYSYATSAKYASDFWVFNSIPGSPVPPPPPPPPPPPVVDLPDIMTIIGQSGHETARYKLTRLPSPV